MSTKETSIKLVKIFTIIYLITNIIAKGIYTITSPAFLKASIFVQLFSEYFSIVPIILFTIFIFAFYGTQKTKILLTLSYISAFLLCFLSIPSSIKSFVTIFGSYESSLDAIRYGGIIPLMNLFNAILQLIFNALFTVVCFTKFKLLKLSKVIVIINAGIYLLYILLSLILYSANDFDAVRLPIILVNFTVIFSHIAYIIFWHFAVRKAD